MKRTTDKFTWERLKLGVQVSVEQDGDYSWLIVYGALSPDTFRILTAEIGQWDVLVGGMAHDNLILQFGITHEVADWIADLAGGWQPPTP